MIDQIPPSADPFKSHGTGNPLPIPQTSAGLNPKITSSRPLVQLELSLQEQAGDLNAAQSRAMASRLERWAHQLRVKAAILEAHSKPRPRRALKPLWPRRLLLN
jgi:hypothetical protein